MRRAMSLPALALPLLLAFGAEAADGDRMCGGIAGLSCGANEYCDYPPGAQCGAADQTGTCRPRPDVCTMIYQPVCGCDGKTYGNSCQAAGAGVSVLHNGACEGSGQEPEERPE